jgi:hypothetical protein
MTTKILLRLADAEYNDNLYSRLFRSKDSPRPNPPYRPAGSNIVRRRRPLSPQDPPPLLLQLRKRHPEHQAQRSWLSPSLQGCLLGCCCCSGSSSSSSSKLIFPAYGCKEGVGLLDRRSDGTDRGWKRGRGGGRRRPGPETGGEGAGAGSEGSSLGGKRFRGRGGRRGRKGREGRYVGRGRAGTDRGGEVGGPSSGGSLSRPRGGRRGRKGFGDQIERSGQRRRAVCRARLLSRGEGGGPVSWRGFGSGRR